MQALIILMAIPLIALKRMYFPKQYDKTIYQLMLITAVFGMLPHPTSELFKHFCLSCGAIGLGIVFGNLMRLKDLGEDQVWSDISLRKK